MSKETSLERYAVADQERKDNIKDNQSVFDRQERIVGKMIDAENDLRDAVTEAFTAEMAKPEAERNIALVGIENGAYRVTCVPQTQTVFDEQKTLSRLNMTKDQAIAAGLMVVNQRPPRITISRL